MIPGLLAMPVSMLSVSHRFLRANGNSCALVASYMVADGDAVIFVFLSKVYRRASRFDVEGQASRFA